MAKSLVGASDGGKVTVAGLSADVIFKGHEVTIYQGNKVVSKVTGAGEPPIAAWAGVARSNPSASGTATSLVKSNEELGLLSNGVFTIASKGEYRVIITVYGSGDWANNYLYVNGSQTPAGNGWSERVLELNEGDTLKLTFSTGKNNTTVGAYGSVTLIKIA